MKLRSHTCKTINYTQQLKQHHTHTHIHTHTVAQSHTHNHTHTHTPSHTHTHTCFLWPEDGNFPEHLHCVVFVIINKRSFESFMCLDPNMET